MPRKRQKSTRGGARKKAGRPMLNNERIRLTLPRETVVLLERKARSMGIKTRGKGRGVLAPAVIELAKTVQVIEPEYIRLAREARIATEAQNKQ